MKCNLFLTCTDYIYECEIKNFELNNRVAGPYISHTLFLEYICTHFTSILINNSLCSHIFCSDVPANTAIEQTCLMHLFELGFVGCQELGSSNI